MSKSPTFVQFFKVPTLLSSFCGLHVPGAHKLLPMSALFENLFKILTFLAIMLTSMVIIDVPITVARKAYPTAIGYFFLAGVYMVLCGLLKVLYMTIRRKEWSDIIHQWDTSFQQPVFPDKRNAELMKERKFVEKIIKWEYGLMVVPMLIWSLSPVVTKKQGMESALPWDHEKSPTFEITAAYHIIYAFFMSATWCANDSWMIIYISLIAAELRHLKLSLRAIFNHSKLTASGKIQIAGTKISSFYFNKHGIELYRNEINKIRKLLNLWIDHNAKLISFSTKLKNFYSPIILLHYTFFVGFICMMSFYIASGLLPALISVVVFSILLAHGFALYLLCYFGDRIATQNILLAEEAFHQDWMMYPKDITTSLRFIIMQSRRSVGLSAFSLMPLNIKSFEQILKACYTFFMFIKDTSAKKLS